MNVGVYIRLLILLVIVALPGAAGSIDVSIVDDTACYNPLGQGCQALPTYVTGDGAGKPLHQVDLNTASTDPFGEAKYSGDTAQWIGTPLYHDNSRFISSAQLLTTLQFSIPIVYFGFYWGTPDDGNQISLYSGSSVLMTFTGWELRQLQGPTRDGWDTYISFNMVGVTIDKIVIGFDGCCFETDNHAYVLLNEPIPEPGTGLTGLSSLLIGGAALLARRRLRKTALR